MKKAGTINGIKVLHSQVLVEFLKPAEMTNSQLLLGENTDVGCPQGIILDFGYSLKDPENTLGLNKGDRVILQGTFVPIPNYDNSARKQGLVEPHNIKCVLMEEG